MMGRPPRKIMVGLTTSVLSRFRTFKSSMYQSHLPSPPPVRWVNRKSNRANVGHRARLRKGCRFPFRKSRQGSYGFRPLEGLEAKEKAHDMVFLLCSDECAIALTTWGPKNSDP